MSIVICPKGHDFVAMSLNLSPAKVGVASFMLIFLLMPKGKHVIRLCDGTASCETSQRILIRA